MSVRAGSRLPAKQLSARDPGCGQMLQFIDERRALPGRGMPAWSGSNCRQRRSPPPGSWSLASKCGSSIGLPDFSRPRHASLVRSRRPAKQLSARDPGYGQVMQLNGGHRAFPGRLSACSRYSRRRRRSPSRAPGCDQRCSSSMGDQYSSPQHSDSVLDPAAADLHPGPLLWPALQLVGRRPALPAAACRFFRILLPATQISLTGYTILLFAFLTQCGHREKVLPEEESSAALKLVSETVISKEDEQSQTPQS
jgi:hypothetical protein